VDQRPTGQDLIFSMVSKGVAGWRWAAGLVLVGVGIGLFVVLNRLFSHGFGGQLGWALLLFFLGGAYRYWRLRVAECGYDLRVEPVPSALLLGQQFGCRALIRANRPLNVGPVRLLLRCEEYLEVAHTNGTRDEFRESPVEEHVEIAPAQSYARGQALQIDHAFTIPLDAPPSYRPSEHAHVEWTLRLSAPVQGLWPDIDETIVLQVAPAFAPGQVTSAPGDPRVPADWGGDLQVRCGAVTQDGVTVGFGSFGGATVQGVPAVSAGETRELEVRVDALADLHCRGVLCRAGCNSPGHGLTNDAELAVVESQLIHSGDLRAGQTATGRLTITIPDSGPVSFRGKHVTCSWSVWVHVDVPIWQDRWLQLPFVVTPRVTPDTP
jgi:hypothetical protein